MPISNAALADIPHHCDGDAQPEAIAQTKFYSVVGQPLWTDPAVPRRLLKRGDVLRRGDHWLRVHAAVLAGNVQHVAVEPR